MREFEETAMPMRLVTQILPAWETFQPYIHNAVLLTFVLDKLSESARGPEATFNLLVTTTNLFKPT